MEPDPWEGVYAANDNTVRCVQSGNPIAGDSEDCLYLNVFTPSVSIGKRGVSVSGCIHILCKYTRSWGMSVS